MEFSLFHTGSPSLNECVSIIAKGYFKNNYSAIRVKKVQTAGRFYPFTGNGNFSIL